MTIRGRVLCVVSVPSRRSAGCGVPLCMMRLFGLALFLLLGSMAELSAAISFDASVDQTRASTQQPIRLTLTITSDESLPHIPAPAVKLDAFDVRGPSIGTRMEFVNGATSFSRDLTYTLYARRIGTFTIGPARLEFQGEEYETNSIAVEIVNIQPGARPRGKGGRGEGDDSETIEDYLFLRVASDRSEAYLGQQVTVTYDLLYRTQVQNVGFETVPSFSGFWFKDLFVASRLDPRRELIDGVAFNATPLKHVALFPTTAGRHEVEPFAITCSVPRRGRRRGGSLFDAFSLFDRSQTLLVRSDPITIDVSPLPEAGRPTDFGGAVGSYHITASAQPTEVSVGDPVTLKLQIEGSGNIQAVTTSPLSMDGFQVYEPKRTVAEQIQGQRYGGKVTFEYILIPERGGSFEIPAVQFSYFDPEQGRYRTARSDPVAIRSHGKAEAQPTVAYGLTRKEIEEVGRDIRHIKPDVGELSLGNRFLHENSAFWAIQAIAPLAYAGLLVFHRHRRRLEGDRAYARRRGARQRAEQRLLRAGELLVKGDSSSFCGQVHRAIRSFVADHENLPEAGLSKDRCAETVASWGADDETVRQLSEVLVACEFGRYAPGAVDASELGRIHTRAKELLSALRELAR